MLKITSFQSSYLWCKPEVGHIGSEQTIVGEPDFLTEDYGY